MERLDLQARRLRRQMVKTGTAAGGCYGRFLRCDFHCLDMEMRQGGIPRCAPRR